LVWEVVYHPDAEAERSELPAKERVAIAHIVEKLEALGPDLPFPHQSAVRGGKGGIRELRPRSGRSPWRPLYRRIGDVFVVLAVGPEAEHDRRGFNRAVSAAEERLREVLREEGRE
jgi:hypothetical protein